MNSPLMQSLFLTLRAIKSTELKELEHKKQCIMSIYNHTKYLCNVATLIGGLVIVLTVSPLAKSTELHNIQHFIPILSFLSFCVVSSAFFIKWRLTVNYKRIVGAIKEQQVSQSQISTEDNQILLNHNT